MLMFALGSSSSPLLTSKVIVDLMKADYANMMVFRKHGGARLLRTMVRTAPNEGVKSACGNLITDLGNIDPMFKAEVDGVHAFNNLIPQLSSKTPSDVNKGLKGLYDMIPFYNTTANFILKNLIANNPSREVRKYAEIVLIKNWHTWASVRSEAAAACGDIVPHVDDLPNLLHVAHARARTDMSKGIPPASVGGFKMMLVMFSLYKDDVSVRRAMNDVLHKMGTPMLIGSMFNNMEKLAKPDKTVGRMLAKLMSIMVDGHAGNKAMLKTHEIVKNLRKWVVREKHSIEELPSSKCSDN